MQQKKFNLIFTIVNRGFADQVVEAAMSAGSGGGTVFYARGTGISELEKFFALSIQPEKEIILNLVKEEDLPVVMHAIIAAAGLGTAGKGLAFAVPITGVAGIVHQLESLDGVKKVEKKKKRD